jgi:branched-subunit amino acid ABC-type transport system permease component
MPETDSLNGAALLLVFVLIGIIIIAFASFVLSGACIIINSIDLHKTKNEGTSIKIPLTYLIINIIIVVLGIAYFPLIEVWGG